jgi:hypothetical protein
MRAQTVRKIPVKKIPEQNRLKRDRFVFFCRRSDKLTRYERIEMRAAG